VAVATISMRRLVARAHLLVPGLFAWLATVATPTLGHEAPEFSRVSALLALAALVAGPYLAVDHPRAGRMVGVFVFMALCLTTWLLLGAGLSVDRLEPVQAGLGGLGWAAFAFGWGSLRPLGKIPEDHPNVLGGTPLRPRGELPAGAMIVLGVSIGGAALCLALAWRVVRADHALLAHAVAIACAIASLSVGAKVAVRRGAGLQPYEAAHRIGAASRWLLALALLVFAGIFWRALR
jgi:hypothetical protein